MRTSKYFFFFFLLFGTGLAAAQDSEACRELMGLATDAESRDAAMICYSEAAECYRQVGNCEKWTECRRKEASLRSKQSFSAAVQYLDATIEAFWCSEGHLLGKLHLLRAFYLNQSGDYYGAGKAYALAAEIHSRTGKVAKHPAKDLYKPMANIHTRHGEWDKAVVLLNQSIELTRERFEEAYAAYLDSAPGPERERLLKNLSKEAGRIAYFFSDLGVAYSDGQQYERAVECYEKGLHWLGEVEALLGFRFPEQYALLWQNKADAFHMLECYPDAHRAIGPVLAMAGQIDTFFLISAFHTKGSICAGESNYPDAIGYIRRSRELALGYYHNHNRREVAKIELTLGEMEMELGNRKVALEHFQQALCRVIPGFDSRDPAVNPPDSLLYPENTIVEAISWKAAAYLESYYQGRQLAGLEEARAALSKAIQAEEVLRNSYTYESAKLQLLEESMARHELLLRVLFELSETHGRPVASEVFGLLEQSRAVIFRERLAHTQAMQQASSGVEAPILQTIRDIAAELEQAKAHLVALQLEGADPESEEVVAARQSVFALQKRYDTSVRLVEKMSLPYYQLRHDKRLVSLDAVRGQLPPDAVLLEYYYGQDSIYILAADKGGATVIHRLGRSAQWEARLSRFLLTLQAPDPAGRNADADPTVFQEFASDARFLYRELLEPVLTAFSSPDRLVIIPDGKLYALPFELLLSAPPPAVAPSPLEVNQAYAGLPYLFKSSRIRYGHSSTIMWLYDNPPPPERPNGLKPYLGVAPSYGGCGLHPVTHGESCVSAVASLMGAPFLHGPHATKAEFLAGLGRYRQLHFHGHAGASDEAPLHSWLAFSCPPAATPVSQTGGAEEEHYLYAYEIYGMELLADLMFIAGCRSGSGKVFPGEGVMNLERAFRYAGVRNIVMGLWEVDAEATAFLTEAFWTHRSQGLDYDEALQQARLDYLSGSANNAFPHYWSGLVLVGEKPTVETGGGWGWWLLSLLLAIAIFMLVRRGRVSSSDPVLQ